MAPPFGQSVYIIFLSEKWVRFPTSLTSLGAVAVKVSGDPDACRTQEEEESYEIQ